MGDVRHLNHILFATLLAVRAASAVFMRKRPPWTFSDGRVRVSASGSLGPREISRVGVAGLAVEGAEVETGADVASAPGAFGPVDRVASRPC